MRVFINALSANLGGGQTYIISLLSQIPPDIHVYVTASRRFLNQLEPQVNLICMEAPWAEKSLFLRFMWENFRLPSIIKKLGIDLLYCTGGSLPFVQVSCRTATIFQNALIFVPAQRKRFPLGFNRFRLWLLQHLQSHSFNKADLLIFISRFGHDLVDKFLPVRKGQSILIPHGINKNFLRDTVAVKERPLPFEYVLYVSYLDFHKNHLQVIDAWSRVVKKRPDKEKLVFIGGGYQPYVRKVKEYIQRDGLNEGVILLGNLDYKDLPIYYQAAKVNIFASSCENYSYILMEAMASGRPVFCSACPPMPEIAGDAAVYFDPYHSQELAALLLKYLDQSQWLDDMGQRAYQRAQSFTCDESSRKTWDAIRAVLEAPNSLAEPQKLLLTQ